MTSPFDARPIVVAIAGPNGAGKTTFYHAHLAAAGLRFVNTDEIARELDLPAEEAARLAGHIRSTLLELGESFIFETVFSDPVGDKVGFLTGARDRGYAVVICFIGLDGPAASDERVAMRVLQGGHDVPADKLATRFPRVLQNLSRAIAAGLHVLVYDNSDLARPYRPVAEFHDGVPLALTEPLPPWLAGR